MQLNFSKNLITGNLAGRTIHCVVRMTPGTGSPAPGEYVIPPPVSDPIYGQTALVIPLKQGSSGFASAAVDYFFKVPYAQAAVQKDAPQSGFAPSARFKVPGLGASAGIFKTPGSAPSLKIKIPQLTSSAGRFKAPGLASSAGGAGLASSAGGAGLASSAGGGAMESAGGAGAEAQSLTKQVLVLSDKPIAGRNCLVVSLGFADLMLGLQASGGASLTVF